MLEVIARMDLPSRTSKLLQRAPAGRFVTEGFSLPKESIWA